MDAKPVRDRPGRPSNLKDPRKSIIKAASVLFAEHGYDKASLKDIAEALGITKAGLYYYFATKQEIYDSIMLEVLEEMIGTARDSMATHSTASDRIRAFMVAHARYFETNLDRYRAVFLGRRGYGIGYTPEQTAVRRAYADMLTAELVAGNERGELVAADAPTISRGILGMLNWIARWYVAGRQSSATDIAQTYADTILNGLTPRQ